MNQERIIYLYKEILTEIGENINRPGIVATPERVATMFSELFRGYDKINFPKVTVFDNNDDGIRVNGMIIDKGYYFTFCEHHMLPFFGNYVFAYIPKDHIIGASKIGRIIDHFSSKLQVAERLCKEIVDCFEEYVKPKGTILMMTGRHLCKEMRGLKKVNSPFEVIDARGNFLENKNNCKMEFMLRATKLIDM